MDPAVIVSSPKLKSIYTSLNVFKFLQVVTLSVFAWEVIATIPKEIRLYRRGFKWTYVLLSFGRYFSLIVLCLNVVFNVETDVTPEFCNRIRYTLPLLASVGQLVSIPLLLLRTYAIWGEKKALIPILFILWVTPMGIGVYACTTYFGVPNYILIPLDFIGGCNTEPRDGLIAVSPFVANLIVDSVVLFLTLGRLIHLKGGTQTSIVRRLLIRDGILYYIVVVFLNIINLIFFLAPGIPENIPRVIFGGPATISVTIMVGRLFFNLQNSFFSQSDDVIIGSDGSRGSSYRNRRNGNQGPMYPMQPIQVSYAVDTTERVDDGEPVGAHQLKSEDYTKKRPVADYI